MYLFCMFLGKLYVAGGFDGQSCLFSAEVYDPSADQWSVLAPMSIRRSGVSLVSCHDKVYAIGGYDGSRRLETGTSFLQKNTRDILRMAPFISSLVNLICRYLKTFFSCVIATGMCATNSN